MTVPRRTGPCVEHSSIKAFSGVRLRFAGDIDLMGGSIGEVEDLTNRLVDGGKGE